ncbi:MAG TPA: chromosomal replication initiator protein DnaA [Solirubrobacteraceae bacterium]|nr:chromosomal replication initiator protein DnaA [Solirubrobacteraceae bacterium]
MSAELDYIWSRVQTALAAAVDEATYRIWLMPLRARELEQSHLVVEVPAHSLAWVSKRFGRFLSSCATDALGRDISVELIPGHDRAGTEADRDTFSESGPEGHTAPMRPAARTFAGALHAHGTQPRPTPVHDQRAQLPYTPSSRSPLGNPKLTFDQFVIGDSNRLAHAAALAVAEIPAHTYNPLFICGPPGVGKTHLLSSIASLLTSHSPELAVRYTTGEAFTNEFLKALSEQRTDIFKAHFRDLDVLLVDDVQFLERKTRTEEEFFHTFNAIYDSGRQLVLACDRPPRNLQALEDRLRERFASGLVADIAPPDLATRLTILRKRAAHDELTVRDDDVLRLIATRIDDHVRALEGALIRVVAFSSLTGRPITPKLTEEVLDGLYPSALASGPSHDLSLADITAAACRHFDLSPAELVSSSRAPRIAWPRQVAMYLARELTASSLPAIGRHFGGRDHTTVMHACRRAAARVSTDPAARTAVDKVRAQVCDSNTPRRSPAPDRSA